MKEHILEILKNQTNLWTKEGDLNQTLLIDLVEKYDTEIINILFNDYDLKKTFFIKVGESWVFKVREFVFYMEENKVNNSYTDYKNRIGLTDGKRFLKDTNDVVLNFPFKDCVLEGGQSTDEGLDEYYQWEDTTYKNKLDEQGNKIKQGNKNIKEVDIEGHYQQKQGKRKEIFFNQVLAKDEIDRLKDPKALTNWARYNKDGKSEVGTIKRDENGKICENLIIKGNNYLALNSLKQQFANKVKLIYIDPPYNKEGKADTFCYNNTFKRSTWLTFMKNRLEVAKDLLSDDGAIIIAIDSKEQYYLGVLIDEIFPEYKNNCITIVHNPRGIQGTNFSSTHEYAFFVYPKGKKIIGNRKINKKDIVWRGLRDNGGESLRSDAKNCFYPIIVKNGQIIGFGNVTNDEIHPQRIEIINNETYIYPIDQEGIERKWRYARQSIEKVKHLLRFKNNDVQIGKNFGQYKTVWQDTRYDANEYGTKLVKSLVHGCKFDFPKSLYNVYDCIYAVVGNDKNAIVLDYHAGSGTTAHAVLELNKDGGNRRFIMIEQMDYVNTITCPRVQAVLEKEKNDSSFVYCELAKWNETAKDKINTCETLEALIKFFDELYERYFLNYNVKIKEFKEKIILEGNFKNLDLDKQKQLFLTMLDLNQMSVNKSEMADSKYGLSENDQNLTKDFYGEQ